MLTEEQKESLLTPEMREQRDLLVDYTHPFYQEIIKLDEETPDDTINYYLNVWFNSRPLETDRSQKVVVNAACKLIALGAENLVLGYLGECLEDLIMFHRSVDFYAAKYAATNPAKGNFPHQFPRLPLYEHKIEVCKWLLMLPSPAEKLYSLLRAWGINPVRLVNAVENFNQPDCREVVDRAQKVLNMRLDANDALAGLGVDRQKRGAPRTSIDEPGLPDPLKNLAKFLIEKGGKASSEDIKKALSEYPGNIAKSSRYPSWEKWIDKHLKHKGKVWTFVE